MAHSLSRRAPAAHRDDPSRVLLVGALRPVAALRIAIAGGRSHLLSKQRWTPCPHPPPQNNGPADGTCTRYFVLHGHVARATSPSAGRSVPFVPLPVPVPVPVPDFLVRGAMSSHTRCSPTRGIGAGGFLRRPPGHGHGEKTPERQRLLDSHRHSRWFVGESGLLHPSGGRERNRTS